MAPKPPAVFVVPNPPEVLLPPNRVLPVEPPKPVLGLLAPNRPPFVPPLPNVVVFVVLEPKPPKPVFDVEVLPPKRPPVDVAPNGFEPKVVVVLPPNPVKSKSQYGVHIHKNRSQLKHMTSPGMTI